jgi:hypothetical protein
VKLETALVQALPRARRLPFRRHHPLNSATSGTFPSIGLQPDPPASQTGYLKTGRISEARWARSAVVFR